ncbi:hypothetical protein HHK36_018779 [Tetracentron sinense]|uniref:LOB domain-containing protein n=1 Tax=Tetracentron sinense TaxID=13715 RepID=A0A834YV11_TETSI|nr:hypothetical protein HHK36_018779 [Tetracentron sinense]
MLTKSPDLPQKVLQIKQDDKFFSRLISKESTKANSSFRVYYGDASGAVPFMWESQPGTPKYTFSGTSLPPLTPPPSYHFSSKKKSIKKHSKSKLMHTIFPRLTPKKTHVSPSPSSSSLSASSSFSSSSTPMTPSSFRRRNWFLSPRSSSFDSRVDDEDLIFGSSTSTSCFGVGREMTGGSRGCYSMVLMKKTLLSIVGHGSGQGNARFNHVNPHSPQFGKKTTIFGTNPTGEGAWHNQGRAWERFEEVGKKIRRETDASVQMGGRQLLGSTGTLNTITPCAACKILRRRCAQECPFSPYFSPHEPQKFASVHKVFGASNVSKMLMEVPQNQRADAANSLVYEANVRLRDPVYGCMGAISALQQQLQSVQAELNTVRAEMLKYKYRETSTNIIPSSNAPLFSTGEVSIAALPPAPPPPPPSLPPASSSSSMFTPSSATDYSSISNENVPYFG